MKLTVLGAARAVTGSCFLVEAPGVRFLVDCGMHQGRREERALNARPFAFEPAALDFVLLTHAHIDHSGLLPRLCAQGFAGPIHATRATGDLLGVLLPDSAHIQQQDHLRRLRRAGRHPNSEANGDSAIEPPLYTPQEAEDCLTQLEGHRYDEPVTVHAAGGTVVTVRFRDAGHILGSAILEVSVTEPDDASGKPHKPRTRRLVFSGDLGQPGRPLMRDPTPIEHADLLVVESTYGNRLHRPLQATIDELVEVIDGTLRKRQGNVIIPAFAVGRTQELLHILAMLRRDGQLPHLRVFVDSPMADRVTDITWHHPGDLDDEARALLSQLRRHPEWMDLHFTQSVDDSMALNRIKAGAIIVAASGMCDAGRIQHHLRHHLGRPECAVVIIGYQAQGTLGRRLVDGAKEVRILGGDIRVRASIHTIGGLSAHADQAALLQWLGHFEAPPKQTLVVHGEEATALGFAELIRQRLGWVAEAPGVGAVLRV